MDLEGHGTTGERVVEIEQQRFVVHLAYDSGEAAAGRPGAVLFDFNHPLAGQPVTFEVRVIGIL